MHLQKKSRATFIFILFAVCLGSMLAVSLILLLLFNMSSGALINSLLSLTPRKELNGKNVLLVGVDKGAYSQRSDTILLLHLNSSKKRIGALSIPRDTRVNIPNLGPSKINHAYAVGGIELLTETVSSFLNIPISHYIAIDLAGVETIIDKLGGVPIYISKNLSYKDNAAGLDINLKKGDNHLNGSEATEYLRYRNDIEGDIGRIKRQQKFLYALSKKASSPKSILSITMMLKQLNHVIDTNLSRIESLAYISEFKGAFDNGNIHMRSIPGEVSLIKGVSYWQPDLETLDIYIEESLFGYMPTTKKETVSRPVEKIIPHKPSPAEERTSYVKKERFNWPLAYTKRLIKIEVLNGNGTPGSALKIGAQLQALGFKVIRIENSKSQNYTHSKCVDWKSQKSLLEPVIKLLSIDEKDIILYDKPNKPLDMTLVLGKDWQDLERKLKEAL